MTRPLPAHDGQPAMLRREAWQRLQPLIPEQVLVSLRSGLPPLAAWRRWRGFSEWDLARRLPDVDDAAVDAAAASIQRMERDVDHMSPRMRHRLAVALDIPEAFLEPYMYEDLWGMNVPKGVSEWVGS